MSSEEVKSNGESEQAKKKNTIKIAGLVAAFIVVAAGAFYGGLRYQKSKAPAGFGNLSAAQRAQFAAGGGRAGAGGPGAANRGGLAGNFTNGQILSADSNSITVKLSTGSSRIVLFSPSTMVMKAVVGSPADLAVGKDVTVTGSSNSDGSITAQNISIRDQAATSTPQ